MSKFSRTLLAATAAFLVSGTAAHADNSFNFDVQGTVPEVCEAINNSLAPLETIDLNSTAEQTLGSITYKCNNPSGFTRTIESANDGQLVNGSQGIDYNVASGGGSGLSFGPKQLTVPEVTNLGGSPAFANGQTGNFRVQVPSLPGGLFAGDYTDTITVSVAGN